MIETRQDLEGLEIRHPDFSTGPTHMERFRAKSERNYEELQGFRSGEDRYSKAMALLENEFALDVLNELRAERLSVLEDVEEEIASESKFHAFGNCGRR